MVDLAWGTVPDPDAVHAMVADATAADGVAPIGENAMLHLADGENLLATDGVTLVGFAHLEAAGDDGSRGAELVVQPDARRRGIGTRIVEALTERAGGLRVWAHGDHPGAAALAKQAGFTRARELWQMRRQLAEPPLAAPRLADGVTVRPFVVGSDEPEFLRVNNAAFDWHPEQGGWDVEQMRLREAEPWFDPAGFFLAVDADDRLLGYHWTKVHDDETPPIGEVYVLGVGPSARGLHLGSALTLVGLAHLRDRGLAEVLLYVESDNAAAIRVYADLGFTRHGIDVSYVR